MSETLSLIVGLGNPGDGYTHTRHNAGFWYVDALASEFGASWRTNTAYKADICSFKLGGQNITVMKPLTFMNRSGYSVGKYAHFYKIPATQILVAQDELDLLPGHARFKQGGGHGGHNGLRNIIDQLGGNRLFYRLRLGIGHPGSAEQVTQHVLNKPSKNDNNLIQQAIEASIEQTPQAVSGHWQEAMNRLHSFKPALSTQGN